MINRISIILTVILLLSSCTDNKSDLEAENSSKELKYSKVEVCREMMRLMGKTTDQLMKQMGNNSIDLSSIALEFRNLSKNTSDEELREGLKRIAVSLEKMSLEASFFEGNNMYLSEIPLITTACS